MNGLNLTYRDDLGGSSPCSMQARLLASFGAALVCWSATAASAATCQFIGGPLFGGIEPPLAVDATCTDPDYNEATFVIDSTEQKSLTLANGTVISYTEVKGHFPATRKQEDLPARVTQSPTTASHRVLWHFPEKKYFRNRFFQQTYPLDLDILNTVDNRFAFESGGGYMVGITPGNPNVGYRVPAAAAKLAKDYANKLYGNTARIYGYMYGQSGGSVQSIGAAENTTGVWDGIVPVVIATDALNVHSFMWGGHYALAVPEAKRLAIAEAATPGSGKDIYADLNTAERAALDELLNAGYPRNVLESMSFSFGSVLQGGGSLRTLDPTYETDFWSKPGYEGANPPDYLRAAIVDGTASIASITRNAQNVPTAIDFGHATMPAFGSTGNAGLQFSVIAAAGTQIGRSEGTSLSGKLEGTTLKLDDGKNDPALLAALVVGGKVRIDNRYALATAFYPRHSILDNGIPAYNQYRNADGTPKHVQRPVLPLPISFLNNVRTAGGVRQTGDLKVKTIVFENLADGNSYPYVAGFCDRMVRRTMGPTAAAANFRVYYQENGIHGAFLDNLPGKFGTVTAATGGTLHQVLLDLADWVERGIAPRRSTRYTIDTMNQVVLPASAATRGGHQPLISLTANGRDRAEVGVNQPVTLAGRIEMPPGPGKIIRYDWYLGTPDMKFEPPVELPLPRTRLTVKRTVSFPTPGVYMITLRTIGQRGGEADSTTPLYNIDRVRVVVK